MSVSNDQSGAGSNAARNFVPPWRLNPAWYRTNLTQSVENSTAGL